MLTSDQKAYFWQKGFVVLPKMVPNGFELESFVWYCLKKLHGISKNDPETWNVQNPWFGMKDFKNEEIFKRIGTDRLIDAINELMGQENWEFPKHWGGFLIDFPSIPLSQWNIPKDGWHVDYHYTHDSRNLFGLRVFTLLSKVKEFGGGTLVVSGSHMLVDKFVQNLGHEEKLQKYSTLKKKFNQSNDWLRTLTQTKDKSGSRIHSLMAEASMINGVPLKVEQFTGEPGDVILMHPWLLHNRAPNASDCPRFMVAKSIYAKIAQNAEII